MQQNLILFGFCETVNVVFIKNEFYAENIQLCKLLDLLKAAFGI